MPYQREAADHLTVLQSFGPPKPTTNPYLVQLLRAIPSDVRVLTFSWRRALLARYDVLHLHWPENLLRSRRLSRTAVRLVLGALLLARCYVTRVAIVQTLHNHAPHERRSFVERLLLRGFGRTTTRRIALNVADATTYGATLIRHGHYRDWYEEYDVPPARPGQLTYIGLIRTYKNVQHLVDVFCDLPGEDYRLMVAGNPDPVSLGDGLRVSAARDHRVELRLGYAEESELADIIGHASLIVLPYTEMNNSGAALLALSLGRPVLVPSAPSNTALALEVGEPWVQQYDGPLTTAVLHAALTEIPTDTRLRPDLSRREWGPAGAAHRDVYAAAADAKRAGRRSRR